MEQEARIAIAAEYDVGSIVDQAATMAEEIDFPAVADSATIEHIADKEEDTDEHIVVTIPEYWAYGSLDFTYRFRLYSTIVIGRKQL